jgi:hypothetical protein
MLIASLLVYGNTALADDCSMGRTPEGVYPMNNEDIMMEYEDIRIYPYEGKAECTFKFLNTGKEKDVLLGFPGKRIPHGDLFDPERESIRDFTASDETGNLTVTEDKAVKPPKTIDNRLDEYSSWFTFKVHFEEGESKTVTNTYRFNMNLYSNGDLLTGYIIKTGSAWKDKIGHAKVTFYMPGLKPYYVLDFTGGPYFRFEEDKIVWERSYFEPTEDLEIYFKRFDDIIKGVEDGEFKDDLIKAEKELSDRLNEINNMGKDELNKVLDFDYNINDGLRLAAYQRLLQEDPFYRDIILMKIGKNSASVYGITENIDYAVPRIFENRTFVPLRFIVENMGGNIGWNEKLKEITIECNFKKIVMNIGKKGYLVNDTSMTMGCSTEDR